MAKNIPKGYKQYTVILPIHSIERLKEICLLDKRSQPKEIEWLIDEKYEELKK